MRISKGLAVVLAGAVAPLLVRWAGNQERRILAEGMGLPAAALDFAKALGIERPEEVRALVVDPIPLPVPVPQWLMRLAKKLRLPVFPPGGMALGRGIFLLPGQEKSLRHELVHVLQYQRLGGISAFMKCYVIECLTAGYADAPMEKEAAANECRDL